MAACLRPIPRVADTPETSLVLARTSLGHFDVLRSLNLRQRFAPHMHDGWAIGIIERGANRLRYRGRDYVADAGSLVVIPPGEMHTGEPVNDEGWSYRMIYPSIDTVRRAVGGDVDLDLPGAFPEPVVDDPSLVARFRTLHATILTEGGGLEDDERLVALLRDLFVRHATGGHAGGAWARGPVHPRTAAVRVVREYIEAHCTELIRLATLAELAAVTPFQLIRLCNRELGMSPYAYVKQLRVQRAQRLLQAGVPVAHVAYAVGFSDQSHLTRTFKAVLGVTPGRYARAVCGA
jgi:AraC-like DNA-binding protein